MAYDDDIVKTNLHFTEKEIHGLHLLNANQALKDRVGVIFDNMTGVLHGLLDTGNSANLHQVEKTLKEFYRNLNNAGVTGLFGMPVAADVLDAGFRPETLTGFLRGSANPFTALTGIEHGYSMKKINPTYTGYAMQGESSAGMLFEIEFNSNNEIGEDSVINVTDYGDNISESNFKRDYLMTLGGIMQQDMYFAFEGAGGFNQKGLVKKWYDQFGSNNLIPTGIGTANPTIFYTGNATNGSTGSINTLFDHVKIQNSAQMPVGATANFGTLKFSSESVSLKCASMTFALHAQGGSADFQGVLGALDAASNQAYIFMSPNRSQYKISSDGGAGDNTTIFQNGSGLTSYESVAESRHHYVTEINYDRFYSYDIFYHTNDPLRNNFDGIGFNGSSNTKYMPNMSLKELIITDQLEGSGQFNKISKIAKTRYGHY